MRRPNPPASLPDKLAITFLTNRGGNIVSLSTPLEPMVKDIVSYVLRLATAPFQLSANAASAVSRVARRPIVCRWIRKAGLCCSPTISQPIAWHLRKAKGSALRNWRASLSNFAAKGRSSTN